MFRCRKCQQEVPERNLIHTVDFVGRPLFKHECGGIVDLFTDVPQPKAITGRSSIICKCGASTWVRSQDGITTCLYCKRQPSTSKNCANCGANDWVMAGFPVANEYCKNCGAIRT